jgi:hypothetical protein
VKELQLDGMSLVRQVSHNFCFELFTYGLATIEQFTMLWKQRGTRWPLSAAQQEVEIVNRSFGPLAAVETVTVEDVSTADKPVVSWSAVTGATAYKITLYQSNDSVMATYIVTELGEGTLSTEIDQLLPGDYKVGVIALGDQINFRDSAETFDIFNVFYPTVPYSYIAYAHMRIGGSSWEQGIVRQSDNAVLSSINSEFSSSSPSAQNFTLSFDKVTRIVTLSMSNNSGVDSVYSLPTDRWLSEAESYSLLLEAFASTQPGQIELSNLSLAVTGVSPVAVDSLLAFYPDVPNSVSSVVTGQIGKGFVLSGTITMSWSATRPVNSQFQAMIRF